LAGVAPMLAGTSLRSADRTNFGDDERHDGDDPKSFTPQELQHRTSAHRPL
jgi:hypothetical protein